MKTELKVGIFAIFVVIILAYMTFKVSGLGVAWKKGYVLHVQFDNISGLDEKSRVKVAGVDAGVVSEVALVDGKAQLKLMMKPDIVIYEDAKASLRMSGLLGDKYLALSAGTSSEKQLVNGDWIRDTESAADIDALANKLSSAASYISDLAEGMQEVFGHSEKKAIRETIHNLMLITKNLNEILIEERGPLHNILVRLESFSEALDEQGPGLITDLSDAARELKLMIEENRYALKSSMENIEMASESASAIAGRIERGEGTLGKLVKDDELYESVSSVTAKIDRGEGTLGKLVHDDKLYDSFANVAEGAGKSFRVVDDLRTIMDFRSEYLTAEGDWKGYFDLTIQTREDLYYILGVVTDPIGSVETTVTTVDGLTQTREEIKERKIEFSAQLVKRFEDFAVRIGVLENTFGFGADYFLFNERARVSLDAWDFSGDEAGAEDAHVKIGLDYKVFKQIFISSGIDNLLNENRRGVYVGAGVRFEDEDLKYLLSLSPL